MATDNSWLPKVAVPYLGSDSAETAEPTATTDDMDYVEEQVATTNGIADTRQSAYEKQIAGPAAKAAEKYRHKLLFDGVDISKSPLSRLMAQDGPKVDYTRSPDLVNGKENPEVVYMSDEERIDTSAVSKPPLAADWALNAITTNTIGGNVPLSATVETMLRSPQILADAVAGKGNTAFDVFSEAAQKYGKRSREAGDRVYDEGLAYGLTSDLAGAMPGMLPKAVKALGTTGLRALAANPLINVNTKLTREAASKAGLVLDRTSYRLNKNSPLGILEDTISYSGAPATGMRGVLQRMTKSAAAGASSAGIQSGLLGEGTDQSFADMANAAQWSAIMQPLLGDLAIPAGRWIMSDDASMRFVRGLFDRVDTPSEGSRGDLIREAIHSLKPGDTIADFRIPGQNEIDDLNRVYDFIVNTNLPDVAPAKRGDPYYRAYAETLESAIDKFHKGAQQINADVAARKAAALQSETWQETIKRNRASGSGLVDQFESLSQNRVVKGKPAPLGARPVNVRPIHNGLKAKFLAQNNLTEAAMPESAERALKFVERELSTTRDVVKNGKTVLHTSGPNKGKPVQETVLANGTPLAKLHHARRALATMARDQGTEGLDGEARANMLDMVGYLDEQISKHAGFDTKELRRKYSDMMKVESAYELGRKLFRGRTNDLTTHTQHEKLGAFKNANVEEYMKSAKLTSTAEKEAFRNGFLEQLKEHASDKGWPETMEALVGPSQIVRDGDVAGAYKQEFANRTGGIEKMRTILGDAKTDELLSIYSQEDYHKLLNMADTYLGIAPKGMPPEDYAKYQQFVLGHLNDTEQNRVVKSAVRMARHFKNSTVGNEDYFGAVKLLDDPEVYVKERLLSALDLIEGRTPTVGTRVGATGSYDSAAPILDALPLTQYLDPNKEDEPVEVTEDMEKAAMQEFLSTIRGKGQ